ncbi:uncharacterized protein BDW70DRAFT_125477 [Aspergillus foveolatus]|uniref:uncharacterized protein n=1 Tax=Aspergillus foveolatus TaxID=210207 RepID=UPI003CCCF580
MITDQQEWLSSTPYLHTTFTSYLHTKHHLMFLPVEITSNVQQFGFTKKQTR